MTSTPDLHPKTDIRKPAGWQTGYWAVVLMMVIVWTGCGRSTDSTPDTPVETDTLSLSPDSLYEGKLSGVWYRNRLGAPATMKLKPISPQRIQFRIDASSGAHGGEVEGFFTVDQNRGMFEVDDPDYGYCRLTFDGGVDSSIRIEQEGCLGYLGVGVAFLGLYDRRQTPATELAKSELNERFGPDAAQALIKLAGDQFEKVAESMHLNEENEDGPEPSETAIYGVRGKEGRKMTCLSVNRQTGEVWIGYIDHKEIRVLGPIDAAPDAFRNWLNQVSEDFGLQVVNGDR